MPLAGHEGVVAVVPEQFGQRRHAFVQMPFVAGLALLFGLQVFGHGSQAGLVVVNAGQQHRAAYRTGRPCIEVGQAHALVGESLEGWRGDFSTERLGIGKAQVVRDDQQDIGAFRRSGLNFQARA
ncbi:hypothetical protein D3C76_1314160 [compost metagenome]